jgi:hypothetical protein
VGLEPTTQGSGGLDWMAISAGHDVSCRVVQVSRSSRSARVRLELFVVRRSVPHRVTTDASRASDEGRPELVMCDDG